LPIFESVSNYLEADAAEQCAVFFRAQTGMIERLTSILSDAFSIARAAIEHQYCRRRGVSVEYIEHPTLVIWREVKQAIPAEHGVESTGKL